MPRREKITLNNGNSRYVRRDENGRFTRDQVDVGRSLTAERRQYATTVAKKGYGDRGDQRR
jgi:hypothetical protein